MGLFQFLHVLSLLNFLFSHKNILTIFEYHYMRNHNRNGKDSGGSAAGTWNSASYTGMKQNLRKAQKEMRETRALARKEGHNIPQSNYETINVSY